MLIRKILRCQYYPKWSIDSAQPYENSNSSFFRHGKANLQTHTELQGAPNS